MACKMFISTIFGDLLAIVIIRSKFEENETLIEEPFCFETYFSGLQRNFLSGFNMYVVNL